MEIIVAIGAICSMTGGVINCAYCLARSIYVMGRDGLLPAMFAKTSDFSHTPVNATMFGAVLSVLFSVFVDFVALIEFLSLVAFVEFIIVAMACVMLRYSPPPVRICSDDDDGSDEEAGGGQKIATTELSGESSRGFESSYDGRQYGTPSRDSGGEKTPLLAAPSTSEVVFKDGIVRILPASQSNNAVKRWADNNPTTAVFACLIIIVTFTFIAVIILTYKLDELQDGNGFAVFTLILSIALAVAGCVPLWIFRQFPEGIPFKVN